MKIEPITIWSYPDWEYSKGPVDPKPKWTDRKEWPTPIENVDYGEQQSLFDLGGEEHE